MNKLKEWRVPMFLSGLLTLLLMSMGTPKPGLGWLLPSWLIVCVLVVTFSFTGNKE